MTSYQHSTSDANSVGNYTHVHRNTKYKIMQTTTDSVQSIIMQSISYEGIQRNYSIPDTHGT